ncbi:MAG: DUF5659 domain-containing protein [Candidatus Binatia bacterium]
MNNDKKISDVSLASYLRARGFKIKSVHPDGRRTEWTFEDVPESEILAYYNGTALVSARELFNAFREMKGLSYQRV